MNIIKYLLIVLIVISLPLGSSAKVMVLPFKTADVAEKSYYWLGKGISYYLSTMLELRNIETFTDAEVSRITRNHSLAFPYRFTKATAMRMAMNNHADKLVWGDLKVIQNEEKQTSLEIRSFIIDIETLKQSYLPIIKGNTKHLYLIQEELLGSVQKRLRNRIDVSASSLRFNNQSYELFVKSLITHHPDEKINLLKNALQISETDKAEYKNWESVIKFELANLHIERDQFDLGKGYLDKISTTSILRQRKIFVEAMAAFNNEAYQSAQSAFLKLKNGFFKTSVNNNLAVIHMIQNEFEEAEAFLLREINRSSDIRIYHNYMHLCLKKAETRENFKKMLLVLKRYPKHMDFISVFFHNLKRTKDAEALLKVFGELVNTENLGDYYKIEFKPMLISPLSYQSYENEKNDLRFVNPLISSNLPENAGVETLLERLEDNPFHSRLHYRLSKQYAEVKQFRRAELFALSAYYLENTLPHIDNLIELYKKIGNRERTQEFQTERADFLKQTE